MKLVLPYPPSVNHYWRHARGRHYVSDEGKAYRKAVADVAPRRKLTGRLEVVIDVLPPDRRKRDLDNVLKALLDALAHAGTYEDDSQIDCLLVERGSVTPGGSVEVRIREIAQ